MMKTRAAVVWETNTPFAIETLDLEPPRAGEVLVKLAAAGVCRSDWNVLIGDTKHPLPVVTGHEGAGVVQEVGAGVTHVKPGDRVALNWAPACGECFYCLNDRPSLCEATWIRSGRGDGRHASSRTANALVLPLGCFADYAVVPR